VKQIYARNPAILEKMLDDELLLIDNGSDIIFNLNPIGTAVWQFLESPRAAEEIMDVLYSAFPDVPREQIYEDTDLLLAQLVNRNLISVLSE
jgi:sensor domain CHASE-containing protein